MQEEKSTPIEEKEKMSDAEVVNSFINDPMNREVTLKIAKEFEAKFRGNWFDIFQVTKKTRFKNVNEALEVLNFMKLMGYLVASMKDEREKYKIVLSKEAKKLEISILIRDHQTTITALEKQLAALEESEVEVQ